MKENVRKSIRKKEFILKRMQFLYFLKDIILLAIGAYIISFGTNMFLLPYKMTTGGASGIATIMYYIANIPMGVTILIVNLPLFLFAIIKLGKVFTIKTIISTVLLSVFLEIFKYDQIIARNSVDLLIACIFGGLICGIGLSLTFKAGASSGGSDLLAQLIYKLTSVQSLSQVLLAIELVIISAVIVVFQDLNIGLYSIISMFISTRVKSEAKRS